MWAQQWGRGWVPAAAGAASQVDSVLLGTHHTTGPLQVLLHPNLFCPRFPALEATGRQGPRSGSHTFCLSTISLTCKSTIPEGASTPDGAGSNCVAEETRVLLEAGCVSPLYCPLDMIGTGGARTSFPSLCLLSCTPTGQQDMPSAEAWAPGSLPPCRHIVADAHTCHLLAAAPQGMGLGA